MFSSHSIKIHKEQDVCGICMNYLTKKELLSNLEGLTGSHELKIDDGCAIISEHGGRVIGLFPTSTSKNSFWVNPRAKEILKSRSWNLGGERFWISPERDFFYKNPEKWEGWFCPEGIDPANYKIYNQDAGSCMVKSNLTFLNQFSKKKYTGYINREIHASPDPVETSQAHAGVSIKEECVIHDSEFAGNGWSLAQVISGGVNNPGTVIIPVKEDAEPLSYFRKIPENRLHVAPDHVSFKIDVHEIYKLAIRPDDIDFSVKTKIAYMLKIPGTGMHVGIVKISDDIPRTQADCLDAARDHPDLDVGVIQSYNSESPALPNLMFGEIELQLLPFREREGHATCTSEHELHVYEGNKKEITEIIGSMCNIDGEPFLFTQ
ncbi:hypothetical protein GF325_16125 [Candidatus Bathyarchaeota archaeon]|nr:hypothetical protein [Candidatus Bathyarchaeota archaeon]